MRSSRSAARLMVALSIAGALAIFLIYTAIAGGGVTTIKPSQLASHPGKVQIVGTVIGPITGDSYSAGGQRFKLRDISGNTTQQIPVVYTGDEGALFGTWKHILITGRMRNGVFVAVRDSMLTKCPSKYLPKKPGKSS
ncbi:MAG TPA: cytochrome c maturation protein CcmE [Gaiellaceae bacterium]|nr:cytochrome c maturation protein CcmE [Gaiellaceae bacterium]